MITKFRVEGEHTDKQELIEGLAEAATAIIRVVNPGIPDQDWECTQDVISGFSDGYKGRMNFVLTDSEVDKFAFINQATGDNAPKLKGGVKE